jgi:hypothetical protein
VVLTLLWPIDVAFHDSWSLLNKRCTTYNT